MGPSGMFSIRFCYTLEPHNGLREVNIWIGGMQSLAVPLDLASTVQSGQDKTTPHTFELYVQKALHKEEEFKMFYEPSLLVFLTFQKYFMLSKTSPKKWLKPDSSDAWRPKRKKIEPSCAQRPKLL